LAAEARVWRERCDRASADARAAYVRTKAAEKLTRVEQVRCRELETKISNIMAAALNEPGRVEGCDKIRFHRRIEASDWAKNLAGRTGEPVEVYKTYPCNTCPRSPVTMSRYWHVGHRGSADAQASKAEAQQQRSQARASARRSGRLVEQRVDPEVLARLREIGGQDG
jgi:hypothetical protein